MRVEPDDEVYRVNAIWLGPPNATMPFRARYVAWGVGIITFILVFAGVRAAGFDLGFFPIAWSLVITVALTRGICRLINHERPLGAVLALLGLEVTGPRRRVTPRRGITGPARIRIRSDRPRRVRKR